MKLINLDNGEILAKEIHIANTFYKRLKGLMFTKNLPSDCGLYIKPCHGIHTFFMNYSIDVLHLDSDNQIVTVEENLATGKIGNVHPHTVAIVELPSGKIRTTQTKVGHKIQFE